jgi:hypothetical protein
MKINHVIRLFLITFVAAVAAGCASAPSHFYTLNSTASGGGAPALNCAVVVGPVSVPPLVDRPQFTVLTAPNRVEIDEFNRWAAPLNDNIARAIAGNLAMLLGTPRVATMSSANFAPTYQVTINIQRFESVPGRSALVDALWTVRGAAGGATLSGDTVAGELVQGDGFDALAAAHSRALAKVSGDIAAAIRVEAEGKP